MSTAVFGSLFDDVRACQCPTAMSMQSDVGSRLTDAGLASVPIPDAVRERVRSFDLGISPDLKRELCPTGVIVFSRQASCLFVTCLSSGALL